MGGTFSKSEVMPSVNGDFYPLRIATLNADIDESINKKSKINTMIEYFMKPYNGYHLDVICIQGIRNILILKELLIAFKQRVEKYNKKTKNAKNKLTLEYFPDIDTSNNTNDNNMYWSTNELENDNLYYDKLMISRHSILQSADVPIGDSKSDMFNNDADKVMINTTTDSDDVSNLCKYIQAVNLNIKGTFVSIYNIELEDDSIGISNTHERRKQINDIKKIIDMNRLRSLSDEVRQFTKDNTTYIACNRDIHIVMGTFHITKIKNGVLSSEYNRMCTSLNALDTHGWIASLRKDKRFYESNVRFTKDAYTLLISKGITAHPDITTRSYKLYDLHKVVIINSNIPRHIVDMNQFTNYPEDTIIMITKPEEHIYTNKHSRTTFRRLQSKSASTSTNQLIPKFKNEPNNESVPIINITSDDTSVPLPTTTENIIVSNIESNIKSNAESNTDPDDSIEMIDLMHKNKKTRPGILWGSDDTVNDIDASDNDANDAIEHMLECKRDPIKNGQGLKGSNDCPIKGGQGLKKS